MLILSGNAFVKDGEAWGKLIPDGCDCCLHPVKMVVDLVKFLEENGREGQVGGKFLVKGGSVRFKLRLDTRGGGVICQVSIGKVTNDS
jgi:hypothetical protein